MNGQQDIPYPPQFLCPLSHVRMQEPMLAVDCGHHFDRAAVEAGIQRAGAIFCPYDRRPLDPNRMVFAREFQAVMKAYDTTVAQLLGRTARPPAVAPAGPLKPDPAAAPALTLLPANMANMVAGWPGGMPQQPLVLNMDGSAAAAWQVSPGPPSMEPPSLGINTAARGKQPRKGSAGPPAAPILLSPLQAQLQPNVLLGTADGGLGALPQQLAQLTLGHNTPVLTPPQLPPAPRLDLAATSTATFEALGGAPKPAAGASLDMGVTAGMAAGPGMGPGELPEGPEDDPDRAPIDPRKYKTRPCRNWAQTGSCSYEHTCCFAHGDSELRDTIANMKILNSLGYFLNDADEMVKVPATDGGGSSANSIRSSNSATTPQQAGRANRPARAKGPAKPAPKRAPGAAQGFVPIHLTSAHLAALQ